MNWPDIYLCMLDSLGFSQEEFLINLAYLSAHMPLDELIRRMAANSSGALRQELQQINPAQLGISEGTQLINYLIENATKKRIYQAGCPPFTCHGSCFRRFARTAVH